MKNRLKNNWGLVVFVISTLISLIQLSNPKHWAHYRIFTGAARDLWQHKSPFFNDYGFAPWYYSPTCGLTYGLFAWMPDVLGIYVYMALSIAIFVLGIRYFLKSISPNFEITDSWQNLFWFWISFELMSGILALKIEITMIGIMFFVVGALIRGRGIVWASLLFAMIINWKFQPLPVLGLITIVLVLLQKRLHFILLTFVFLIAWYYLPLLVIPADEFAFINSQWKLSVNQALGEEWRNFVHVYKFMVNALQIPLTYEQVMKLSAVGGGVMALVISAVTWFKRRSADAFLNGLLLAFAFGSAYIVGFSPMGQTNAYVLAAPALLVGVYFLLQSKAQSPEWHSWLSRAVLMFGVITGVVNSDIVTKHGRLLAVHLGLKPLGSLILVIVVAVYLFKTTRQPKQA